MSYYKHYLEQLYTEKASPTIHVFDIDDTLLVSKSKIRAKRPGSDVWEIFNSQEFAKARETLPPGTEFDFSDFDDFRKVISSLIKGTPNVEVLKIMDQAIQKGEKIGALTARGNQEGVYIALKLFLKYMDQEGNLQDLPEGALKKSYVWAISDERTKAALHKMFDVDGNIANPSALKATVLQKIFGDMYGFSNINFYDDDEGNIKAVNDLNDSRINAVLI